MNASLQDSPYQEGAQSLQTRLGVREQIERTGRRVIRDSMPDQHREFFAQLPWVLVSSVDQAGRPWASVLTGGLGFIVSPDPRSLAIDAMPPVADILARNLEVGAPLGLLGLELHTRRRNRLNGTVSGLAGGRIELRVDQSFGNCPRYINRKKLEPRTDDPTPAASIVTDRLNHRQCAIVARADTLFIASSYLPESGTGSRYGVDVSHRGGRPGFVRIEADGSLSIPDYIGNFAFSTLGNIEKDGRCGLLFIDFDSGDILQLTAEAWIDWDALELENIAGVQRLVRVRPAELRLLCGSFPFRAEVIDYSSDLEAIGSI